MCPTEADHLIQISSGMTLTYKNINGEGRWKEYSLKQQQQQKTPQHSSTWRAVFICFGKLSSSATSPASSTKTFGIYKCCWLVFYKSWMSTNKNAEQDKK